MRNVTLDDLVARDSLTSEAAEFLRCLMQLRSRVAISGEPGAGKTTLAAALLAAAPPSHCVRSCEEIRELAVPITHGSYYEVRPPSLDGTGEITMRDLVKFVLAMRPDRIVVGEVRGAEAFELSRAVNAGCGFLCTVHANTAAEALDALVNAALMAGENVTERIVRKVFSGSLDVVIHVDRDDTAGDSQSIRRRVMEIAAVVPALRDDFTIEPLFTREHIGAPLRWTGALPTRLERRMARVVPGAALHSVMVGGGDAVVIVVAASCIGVFVYALVGLLIGQPVRVQRRRRPPTESGRRQLWLTQAGVALSPAQFWLGSVAAAAIALVAGIAVTGAPLVALVPAVAVGIMPRAYFARRRATRLRQIQAAWPDGLRDVVASISAGRSLTAAVGELAVTGPAALRDAFGRFSSTSRMLGTSAALEVVKEELADPTSDRVIEVLILASERGGQIVKEILEDLVVATTKDLKVLDEIETEGLEMRINARAVLVLPWFVLLALTIRGGAFRDFYQSGAGVLVVAAGGVLSAIGYAWITRLSVHSTSGACSGADASATPVRCDDRSRARRRRRERRPCNDGSRGLHRPANESARITGAAVHRRRACRLRGDADVVAVRAAGGSGGIASRVFGPPLRAVVFRVGSLVERRNDDALALGVATVGRGRPDPRRPSDAGGRAGRAHGRAGSSGRGFRSAVRSRGRGARCSRRAVWRVHGTRSARSGHPRARGTHAIGAVHGEPAARDPGAHGRGSDPSGAACRGSR